MQSLEDKFMIEKHLKIVSRINKINKTKEGFNDFLVNISATIFIFLFVAYSGYLAFNLEELFTQLDLLITPYAMESYQSTFLETLQNDQIIKGMPSYITNSLINFKLSIILTPIMSGLVGTVPLMILTASKSLKVKKHKTISFTLFGFLLMSVVFACYSYTFDSLPFLFLMPKIVVALLALLGFLNLYLSFIQIKDVLKKESLKEVILMRLSFRKEKSILEEERNSFYQKVIKEKGFIASESGMSKYNPQNEEEQNELNEIVNIYKKAFSFKTNLDNVIADSEKTIKKEHKTFIIND